MATYQVNANADDCWRRLTPSLFNTTNIVVAVGGDSSNSGIGSGIRFNNILIPQGAIINTAYLQLYAYGSAGSACNSRISAEDVDNPGDFSGDTAASFDTRFASHTTSRIDWDSISTWTADTWYDSPSIISVIQEIVDRGGWNSDNSIVIFWEDFDYRSTNSNRGADSYNGSPSTAPKLVIEFLPTFIPKVFVM